MPTLKPEQSVFCTRLKQARLTAGLSQKALGIASGLDEFTASTRINRYELGIHKPDPSIVDNLAQALQVPTAFLYTQDDELAEVILKFSRLSPIQRKMIINILDGLDGE